MPPAELLKLAKKHKISAELLKYEVIEALLAKVNAEKEAVYAKGILEVMNDGWGFLRKETYQPSPEDTYVGQTLIKKLGLRGGDIVFGLCKPQKEGEKYRGLFRVESVNNQGLTTFTAKPRKNFDELTPLFPDERLVMETSGDNIPTRIVDLISPIGKGQRALIVSPPKAGKTTMMKSIANAIAANHPEVFLMVLLVDERPEEVTDMRRSVRGQVISSTFDEPAENHMRVAELCMEQAKRLVESGRDVVIMLDSLTRLSRASNLTINPSGRTLTGGLDPSALYRPRRFFGAARNIEEGGSLTIIASVLVDTGSKMDESIFEELKGTGNSEIILDRELSERRIWPAIDVRRSSTRQEQLLFNPGIYQGVVQLRRLMAKEQNSMEATEQFIKLIKRTPNNAAFIESVIQRTSAAV
ncbi:MAG: transcription termination factor Rho [Armatimonadetes bacterium Cent15-Ar3]|nr:MAG: transcription termination factor Rho [Armatimonadetes bacterium Cent15-Ar3]